MVELTKRYNVSVMNNPGEILPLAAVTAALYLAMSYPGVVQRRVPPGHEPRLWFPDTAPPKQPLPCGT